MRISDWSSDVCSSDLLETLLALRVVDRGNIHQALELTLAVIAQECQDLDHRRRSAVQRQLAADDADLRDILPEMALDVARQVLERGDGFRSHGRRHGSLASV